MPEIIGNAVDLIAGVTVANMKHEIAELKNKVADLMTENLELKERIKTLEKKNALVFRDDGLYYSPEDTDNRHPYCPACFENGKREVHLLKSTLKCPVCETGYMEPKPPYFLTSRRRYTSEDMFRDY
jgi:FtsZ-binding cell division protein ZapB